jgi:glycosyltransferase involved in cell wall biosynthesis
MSRRPPRVSVVIPTFRHSGLVLESISSAEQQGPEVLEIIVVNDGSPDDTARVLKPLIEAGRITYIWQQNRGQGHARNRGIAEARGEFIALLDDDDVWPADRTTQLVRALDENPHASLAYGYALVCREDGLAWRFPEQPGPSGSIHTQIASKGWIRSPGQTLIRAAELKEIGGFDGNIWGTDDWDLYLRLSSAGSFIYRDVCTLRYREHSGSASRDVWRMYVNARKVIDKNFPIDGFETTARLRRQAMRFVQSFCAADTFEAINRCIANRCIGRAIQLWIQAWVIDPRQSFRPGRMALVFRILFAALRRKPA